VRFLSTNDKEKIPDKISKITILLGVSLFFILASWFFGRVQRSALLVAAHSVCSRVAAEYVKNTDPSVLSFIEICHREASKDVATALKGDYGPDPRRALISVINDRLSALRVSHLSAYAPDETAALWTREAVDTGVRARWVDGEAIIQRLVEKSPAARAGIRVGDLVIAVDGIPLSEIQDLERASGVWEILRPDETRVFLPVVAETLQDSVVPYWLTQQERDDVRVLRIPSFLPQAIDNEDWPRVRDQIARLSEDNQKLVIDLRGNPGGSFPAMLRVLGLLKCDRDLVGWIYRGEAPTLKDSMARDRRSFEMTEALEAEPQLEQLAKNGAIALVPFQKGPCFEGPIGVLIDQDTGSVAEIFAQALKERPRTLVAGWRSAGHVVMARWFQIAGLSSDYTVSVPVALFRSAKGEELEGRGVSPDQLMTDSLKRWRSSKDPWIADLIRSVNSL